MLDYPLVDVLDLIRDQIQHNRRTRTAEQQPEAGRAHVAERVIYRKADDSWF